MISRFFIDRPIFANVIAIVTMLVGLVSLSRLPIEQYPQITPPTVQVVDHLSRRQRRRSSPTRSPRRSSSRSTASRTCSTCRRPRRATAPTRSRSRSRSAPNLDTAQVLVQNRVPIAAAAAAARKCSARASPAKKQSTNIILFVVADLARRAATTACSSANYATLRIRDELSRVDGVGDVTVFGAANYSMRVWLDPEKLKARGLTTQDVVARDPRAERAGRRRPGRPAAGRRDARPSSTRSRRSAG